MNNESDQPEMDEWPEVDDELVGFEETEVDKEPEEAEVDE